MKPGTPTINPGPVLCAGRVATITDAIAPQPSVRTTLTGWFKPMTIGVVTEGIIAEGARAGEAGETVHEIRTSGMMQPGDGETLDIKAEGQRSWKTAVLHVYRQLDVETDTVLKIKDVRYRVTAKKDFVENGYIRYELLQDFE